MLDKIAFLENENFDIKKICDELKSENQVFKNELSLRKENSHPTSKRLSDFINSGRKSFDKRCLGFVNETTTPSSGKTIFAKPCERVLPKETLSKLKLHCTHCTKMGHTVNRCYARMFESFQRKLTNLMNKSFTLRNRLSQGGKTFINQIPVILTLSLFFLPKKWNQIFTLKEYKNKTSPLSLIIL